MSPTPPTNTHANNLLEIATTPARTTARGSLYFASLLERTMDDAFLASLRCPLDPARDATLHRDDQSLVCSRCSVRFPIKQGLPILVPDEGELPAGIAELSQLACQRTKRRGPRN